MKPGQKLWHIDSKITPEADEALHGYPPILRQILFSRGFATHDDARRYLEALKPPGTSAENLLGMAEGLDRIQWSIRNNERIVIYGDYDADGVTATALLVLALTSLGADVHYYIPSRFDEGYGLNIDALEAIKEDGTGLVITVDCGIRSINEVEHAKKIGLDLIITDHHNPGIELPSSIAIIDPKQPGDSYPEKDLAGVGIAYKILEGLKTHPGVKDINYTDYLDLVALGTVADLVPLVGENRYLVREGLHNIRQTYRQGIMSLLGVAGLNPKQITASDIGFALGPRLNAAGRLESAQLALELLISNDVQKTGYLAQRLESHNRERQKITRSVQEQAEKIAFEKDPNALILFASDPNFNPGVVGLAASRLTDRYYKPAVVGYEDDEFTRASCRSIKEFHITTALDQCSDLLEHYGGHAAAAGFTVKNKNLPELMDRLKTIAEEQLSSLDLRPTIHADVELRLSDLDHHLIDYLKWLQPTGYGNPSANFISRNLQVRTSKTIGKDKSHLKLIVSDGWITYDAIAFRQGYWQQNMPKLIDVIYSFEKNEYQGRENLQLNVKDIRPTGAE
jgi:single-stranded-DNA-specific exonuclease